VAALSLVLTAMTGATTYMTGGESIALLMLWEFSKRDVWPPRLSCEWKPARTVKLRFWRSLRKNDYLETVTKIVSSEIYITTYEASASL
jgi:hypothetical protein